MRIVWIILTNISDIPWVTGQVLPLLKNIRKSRMLLIDDWGVDLAVIF